MSDQFSFEDWFFSRKSTNTDYGQQNQKKKATRKTPPKITPQNTHTTKLKFKKPKQNTIHDQKQSPPYFSYPPLSMLKENTKHEWHTFSMFVPYQTKSR